MSKERKRELAHEFLSLLMMRAAKRRSLSGRLQREMHRISSWKGDILRPRGEASPAALHEIYYPTRATVSRQIISSSLVGIVITVTLEVSVEIIVASPRFALRSGQISTPRYPR